MFPYTAQSLTVLQAPKKEKREMKKFIPVYLCVHIYSHTHAGLLGCWVAGLGLGLGARSWSLLRSAVLGEGDDRRRALALVPRGGRLR